MKQKTPLDKESINEELMKFISVMYEEQKGLALKIKMLDKMDFQKERDFVYCKLSMLRDIRFELTDILDGGKSPEELSFNQ